MPNQQDSMYEISIIVPVYNKEHSLDACFDSLDAETAGQSVEVILIDDGSTDSSRSLCEEYARERDNVRFLSQDNQGVSSARNRGIGLARGQFLLFLDADDALSPQSVCALRNSIAMFGDRVDVISYPLLYVDKAKNKVTRHLRERWLVDDDVYKLSDYPYIAQTTMNVCVRNRCENNILFSEDVHLGEDQLYITKNLVDKAAIGYCSGASYLYTRDGSGASSRKNNPLYSYNDMIKLFSELLQIGESCPQMSSYAYQIILYNLSWRIKSDMLFPVFLKGESYQNAETRLSSIVARVPLREIIDSPYLNNHHKGFIIRKFLPNKSDAKVFFCPDSSTTLFSEELATEEEVVSNVRKTCIIFDDGTKWYVPKPVITLTKCMERVDGIHIEGRIISPAFAFSAKPKLYFIFSDGMVEEVALEPSSFDYSGARFPTTKCWTIRFVLSRESDTRISFELASDTGSTREIAINFKRGLLRYNARRESRRLYFPRTVLFLENNELVYRRKNALDSIRAFSHGFRRDNLMFAKRASLRSFQRLLNGRKVWLYSDLPTSQLESNAFIQIRHDLKMDDNVLRFYITDDVEAFIARNPDMKDHVLKRGSKRHFYYALSASVIMASYLERFTYQPFRKRTYSGLADLVGNQWVVYLQHGVLHAHLPWYYSFDRIAFDREVVSTSFEIQNLCDKYCFPSNALITSGMARFDSIKIESNKPRRILYAPSWRNYLVDGNGKKRVPVDDRLLASPFYRGLSEFLYSEELSAILEQYGYQLDVKMHPNFACYNHLLDFDTKYIKMIDSSVDENDYSVLITDFSSYVFDFVYADCSIMYFMPDRTEFDAGLNQYRLLDLPLEDAFGPYSSSADEAVSCLKRILAYRSGEADEQLDAYRERGKSFFLHHDHDNSQRLYDALVMLDGTV